MSPAIVVMFTNQPKTIEASVLTTMYTRGLGMTLNATAYQGVPKLLHFMKIFGACPSALRPYNLRDARNIKAQPDEMAEVQTTALMIEGRTLIPAAWKAMTKGDEAAVPVDFDRASLLYGTIMPTMRMLRT